MNCPDRVIDAEEVLAILDGSGIPAETLDTCSRLVYEWERSNEPDARVLVVRLAQALRDGSGAACD
jgi:hypothetical protein